MSRATAFQKQTKADEKKRKNNNAVTFLNFCFRCGTLPIRMVESYVAFALADSFFQLSCGIWCMFYCLYKAKACEFVYTVIHSFVIQI
jgi:hypothetical protein